MEITSTMIKALRDRTGISVMQCKKALEEAGGDHEKAVIILQRRRKETADKKSDRTIAAGVIGVYLHNTKEVASLVKLGCETDFVAKNENFIKLANDLALHVTASSPKYISRDDVDENTLTKAKEVFATEVADKPKKLQTEILKGKLESYFKEQILLEQSFVKNPDITISDMLADAVQKFGENVTIVEMTRLSCK